MNTKTKTKTKRHETKRNETKRNKTKQNETKQKRNKTKRNEILAKICATVCWPKFWRSAQPCAVRNLSENLRRRVMAEILAEGVALPWG